MFYALFFLIKLIRALPRLLQHLFRIIPHATIAIRDHGPLVGFILIWLLVIAFAVLVVVMALASAWATISSLFPIILVALLAIGCCAALMKALLWLRGRAGGGQP